MVRRLLAAEAIEEFALPSGSDEYRTPTPSDTLAQDDPPAATPGEDAEPAARPVRRGDTVCRWMGSFGRRTR